MKELNNKRITIKIMLLSYYSLKKNVWGTRETIKENSATFSMIL